MTSAASLIPKHRRHWTAPAVLAVLMLVGCGPEITSVEPDVLAAGAEVTITGTGFVDDVVARLEAESGASVQLGISAVNNRSLVARVPSATPPGFYDVVVAQDGTELRLSGALEVRAGEMRIRFLDIGQGDSTLIIGPGGEAMLIDGGPRDAANLVRIATSAPGVDVRHTAITHTDADHLGGMVAFLAGEDGSAGTADDVVPQTRWIGHDDAICDSQLCGTFRNLQAQFSLPDIGDVVDLGGPTVTVIGRDGVFGAGPVAGATDPNERSLALLVEFAGRKVFIGGDLTGGGISTVNVEQAAALEVGPVDVLRVNHHGSATSSSAGFLAALQPTAVVLSMGTDNQFCHPEPAVLARLAGLGVPIYATGEGMVFDGDRCDGPSQWPAQAAPGLSNIDLVILTDGTLSFE